MKVKPISVEQRDFTGSDGVEREYFWYKALRVEDDVNIQFGSEDGDLELDKVQDLNIVKEERNVGKGFVYKHKKDLNS